MIESAFTDPESVTVYLEQVQQLSCCGDVTEIEYGEPTSPVQKTEPKQEEPTPAVAHQRNFIIVYWSS